ncbi:MAG: DUF3261 domain-containing protein [Pseudomonadales bacterium]|nr:DUF3261 domain-containing protein [Pseudomonadales bacterium]
MLTRRSQQNAWQYGCGLLLLCTLAGCSAFKAYLSEQAFERDWFPLQTPAALFETTSREQSARHKPVSKSISKPVSKPISVSHFVRFSREGTVFTAIHQLEWNNDMIALAGLSHMGGALFSLTYDGHTLELNKSPLLPDMFHPGFVLRDYQLSLLSLETLKVALAGTELRVEEVTHERRFYRNNRLIFKVVTLGATVNRALQAEVIRLHNYVYDYQITLEPIEAE